MASSAIVEKYIDATAYDADYEIRKHLANGWYVYHEGLTLIILRKDL